MLVLVTGATGRIGSCLTRALIREGHSVRALLLPDDSRAPGISGPHVETVRGRLEDTEAVGLAVRGVDVVYHLAAALTSRGHTDEQFFEVNLRGTFNLLTAVRRYVPRLQHFVYASSDAVYLSGPRAEAHYLPIDEAHPRQAGTVYGASKIGAEELCLAFWRSYGIPVTILRFGATAAAEELIDPKSVFARWLFLREAIRYLNSIPRPSSEQVEAVDILKGLDNGTEQLIAIADQAGKPEIRQWADARDIADGCAHVLGLEAAVGEAFILCGAAPFSTAELAKHMAAALALPYVTACVPTARSPWYLTCAKAGRVLGYEPQYSVYDMVREALAATNIRGPTA